MKLIILLFLFLSIQVNAFTDYTTFKADAARTAASKFFTTMYEKEFNECLSGAYTLIYYTSTNALQNFAVYNPESKCWGQMSEKLKEHLEKNGYRVTIKLVGVDGLAYYHLIFIDWIK